MAGWLADDMLSNRVGPHPNKLLDRVLDWPIAISDRRQWATRMFPACTCMAGARAAATPSQPQIVPELEALSLFIGSFADISLEFWRSMRWFQEARKQPENMSLATQASGKELELEQLFSNSGEKNDPFNRVTCLYVCL